MINPSETFNARKRLLNFRIKDLNEDIQKLNAHLYNISLLNMLVFIIATIPIVIFSITFFKDPNLQFYFKNLDALDQVLSLPSQVSMFAPLVVAWVFGGLSAYFIVWIKPVISSMRIKNTYKNSFWIILLCLQILCFLFSAVAQYQHTMYQDFFNFESLVSENIASPYPVINEVSKFFTSHIHDAYNWTTEDGIWWILFAQILVMFMLSLSIENGIVVNVDRLNIEKYITYYNKKDKEFDNSKVKYFFNKIFNNSEKTLAVWTIITAFCILLPSCIYVIVISFNTTPLARLSSFLNSFPNLMQRFDGAAQITADFTQLIAFSNRYFTYSSLPVLIIGISFSTLLYFVSVSIRGEGKSEKAFIVQYFIIGFELFAVLGFSFYSQLEMNALIQTWNQDHYGTPTGIDFINQIKQLFTHPDDLAKIVNFYELDSFDKQLQVYLLNPISTSSQIVVYSSLLLSSFTIIGKSIFDKSHFKNKLVTNLNKEKRG